MKKIIIFLIASVYLYGQDSELNNRLFNPDVFREPSSNSMYLQPIEHPGFLTGFEYSGEINLDTGEAVFMFIQQECHKKVLQM